MASKISRYTTTGWVQVSDLDSLDTRITTLETTSIANATVVTAGNARMGARAAPYATQARFGHKDETGGLNGWLAAADGTLEANVGAGKNLNLYDQTGLIGSFALTASDINGLSHGTHPVYGAGYRGIWRTADATAGKYIILANASDTFINAPGGSLLFRRNNTDIMTIGTDNIVSCLGVVRGSGNTDIGNNSIYFNTYGGGFYMQDTTWLRTTNSKSIWANSGQIAAAGGIMAGTSALTAGYIMEAVGSMHVTGNHQTDGQSNANTQVRSTSTYLGGNWASAAVLVYGVQQGDQQTAVAIHSPGAAPQLIAIGAFGYTLFCRNETAGASGSSAQGASRCWASEFVLSSSITVKREVRSLRPERDFLPVEVDAFSDTVDELPDIMSLRPVVYRPMERETEIVATHPSGDYATVDPSDPTTFKSIPRMDYMGDQSDRERLGLIAEEVRTVIPSAVFNGPDKEASGIFYSQITVALLDHVQQLTRTVETLRYRITELERDQ